MRRHRSFSVVRLNSAKMIASDHEARDDLRLAPADQLEVVVERRHPEDALAGQLERADLDDDRQRLEDEDAADDRRAAAPA